MSENDEMVLKEAQRQMLSDFARMQANATIIPDLLLGDTWDTWFKEWPKAAPRNVTGLTPEDAFLAATQVPLLEVIRLGQLLWDRTKAGDVTFTAASFTGSADPGALALMKRAASLPVAEYRKRLVKERKKGYLAHRRYTFTERPLLEVGADEFIALRPEWVLDRLCGSQLYWQTFFDLGTEKDTRGEQFSLAMNYVFEYGVGYLFRRVTRRARPAIITLIPEEQMQQAWKSGGNTPSVCDWVLVSGKYCLLVDATNHWLDEKAAQGFGAPEDYQADTEETFVNKKFQQLKSSIELLAKNGWEGCTFDEETVYVPLVIVPNAGIPATVLADVDIKLRSHTALGQLGKIVTSPGILIYHELQVFEGLCEHRRLNFVELLARWRALCAASMPVRPQTFLDLSGLDRPMSTYPTKARSMLTEKLGLPKIDLADGIDEA